MESTSVGYEAFPDDSRSRKPPKDKEKDKKAGAVGSVTAGSGVVSTVQRERSQGAMAGGAAEEQSSGGKYKNPRAMGSRTSSLLGSSDEEDEFLVKAQNEARRKNEEKAARRAKGGGASGTGSGSGPITERKVGSVTLSHPAGLGSQEGGGSGGGSGAGGGSGGGGSGGGFGPLSNRVRRPSSLADSDDDDNVSVSASSVSNSTFAASSFSTSTWGPSSVSNTALSSLARGSGAGHSYQPPDTLLGMASSPSYPQIAGFQQQQERDRDGPVSPVVASRLSNGATYAASPLHQNQQQYSQQQQQQQQQQNQQQQQRQQQQQQNQTQHRSSGLTKEIQSAPQVLTTTKALPPLPSVSPKVNASAAAGSQSKHNYGPVGSGSPGVGALGLVSARPSGSPLATAGGSPALGSGSRDKPIFGAFADFSPVAGTADKERGHSGVEMSVLGDNLKTSDAAAGIKGSSSAGSGTGSDKGSGKGDPESGGGGKVYDMIGAKDEGDEASSDDAPQVIPYNFWQNVVVACGSASLTLIGLMLSQYLPLMLQLRRENGDSDDASGSGDSTGTDTSSTPVSHTAYHHSSISGFGVAPLLASFILMWDQLIGIAWSPWIGDKSDRTWAEWIKGRRKPFVIVALPVACLMNVLTSIAKSPYELCTYVVLFSFFMATVRPVYAAYLGDLFPASHRSRASGVNLFGNGIAAGIALLAMGPVLETAGLVVVMSVMSTVSLILMTIPMLMIQEPRVTAGSLEKETMDAPGAPVVPMAPVARFSAPYEPPRAAGAAVSPVTSRPGSPSSEDPASTSMVSSGATATAAATAPATSAKGSGKSSSLGAASRGGALSGPSSGAGFAAVPVSEIGENSAAPSKSKKRPGVLNNFVTLWKGEHRSCWFVLLAVFFVDIASSSIQTGLVSFAVMTIKISPGYTLYYMALFAGTYTLAAIPAGSVKDRTRRYRLINFSMLALLAVAPTAFFAVTNKWTFAVALTLLGGFSACITVNLQPLIYDEGFLGADIGALTGMYYFSLNMGSILGKFLTGILAQLFGGFRVIFLAGGLSIGCACICMNIALKLGERAPLLHRKLLGNADKEYTAEEVSMEGQSER